MSTRLLFSRIGGSFGSFIIDVRRRRLCLALFSIAAGAPLLKDVVAMCLGDGRRCEVGTAIVELTAAVVTK